MDLADLTEDPENARTHSERNINAIKLSLDEFGQVEPLVVQASNGKVIGGNGRLQAMRDLGWVKAKVVKVDMDDKEAKALAIALNRTAELAEWNYETLAGNLGDLVGGGFDVEKIGWLDHEVEPLMQAEWKPPEVEDMPEPAAQNAKPIQTTKEQRMIIDQAISKIRKSQEDATISEGRCLELICGDYLASPE